MASGWFDGRRKDRVPPEPQPVVVPPVREPVVQFGDLDRVWVDDERKHLKLMVLAMAIDWVDGYQGGVGAHYNAGLALLRQMTHQTKPGRNQNVLFQEGQAVNHQFANAAATLAEGAGRWARAEPEPGLSRAELVVELEKTAGELRLDLPPEPDRQHEFLSKYIETRMERLITKHVEARLLDPTLANTDTTVNLPEPTTLRQNPPSTLTRDP